MSRSDALDWWFAQANYEQRTPTPDDLKLERMRLLLARLGDPHLAQSVVHVAGSKGKGTTSALLATILDRAGYRVGLFTSPHLTHLEERFQVSGQPIRTDELQQLAEEIRSVVRDTPHFLSSSPTFFEIATAIGFLHFLRNQVDVTVLEVGLGGRLDSTNVCSPALSVITSISYDHTHLLGTELSQIAREKAGIVKPGVPVVSGVLAPEARRVIEEVCQERAARLVQLDRDIRFTFRPGRVTWTNTVPSQVDVATTERRWSDLELNLLGEHQGANAAVAIGCIEELRLAGWKISEEAVRRGMAEVQWPARVEVFRRSPLIVLDCAHNVASAEALVRTLDQSFPTEGRRLLVFAGSMDKDLRGMFRVLAPRFDVAFVTRFLSNARSVPPEQLASFWSESSQNPVTTCISPQQALENAIREAQPDDLICITGSVFLAGEVRPFLIADQSHPFSLASEPTSG